MNQESFAFVVYMIHQCALRWHVSPASAYERLYRSGCIGQYLVPHYEVLHTLSSRHVVEDIELYLSRREMAG